MAASTVARRRAEAPVTGKSDECPSPPSLEPLSPPSLEPLSPPSLAPLSPPSLEPSCLCHCRGRCRGVVAGDVAARCRRGWRKKKERRHRQIHRPWPNCSLIYRLTHPPTAGPRALSHLRCQDNSLTRSLPESPRPLHPVTSPPFTPVTSPPLHPRDLTSQAKPGLGSMSTAKRIMAKSGCERLFLLPISLYE